MKKRITEIMKNNKKNNKKNKSLISILGCFMLLCSGCSASGNVNNVAGIYPELEAFEGSVIAQTDPPSQGAPELSENQGNGSKSVEIDNVSVKKELNQFQGMDEIQYAGEDKILVFADKIYLYELTGKRVIAETEYPDSDGEYGDLRTWITDSGYVIAYKVFSETPKSDNNTTAVVGFGGGHIEGSYHIMYAYYDANLCMDKTIDVTELEAELIFLYQTAPSRDGGRIAVCDRRKGIYVYDVNTHEKTEVLQVDENQDDKTAGSLSWVSQIAFAENDSRIVFLGSCIENGESYTCYGSVKTDGSGLSIHRGNKFDVMSVLSEYTIFSEDIQDDRASGEVWAYDPSGDSTQIIKTSEKIESNCVWGSDKGNYFVTAVEKENIGWELRLYDVRTGKLVTKVYELGDTEAYRAPHICYLEDRQMAVLLQRPYGDNKQFKAGIVSFK